MRLFLCCFLYGLYIYKLNGGDVLLYFVRFFIIRVVYVGYIYGSVRDDLRL